jgi:hypothetical protein
VIKCSYVARLTMLAVTTFVLTSSVARANICTLQGLFSPPPGPIADRWTLTGGPTGPMRCGIAPVGAAPGGVGELMHFQNGQIVTSPKQGTNMTVAVYQQGADVILEWGDTLPWSYDKFIVRWDKNNINVGQRDVPNGFHTRGLWFLPPSEAGTYSIIVEGCGGSTCNQGWTVPVSIAYVPPLLPNVNSNCTFILPGGPIRDRWIALGGLDGPLGCPDGNQQQVSNTKAFVASFDNGQVVWDPDRGNNMTVAAYQVESDIAVEWGPTDPFPYDDFNVLWSKDGVIAPQVEVDQYLDSNGNKIYPGPNNHGIYSIRGVGPGKYSIQIEGCDKGSTGPTCHQSWTVPVTVQLKVLGFGIADVTYHMPQCHGAPPLGGVIGDRWSKLVGTNGPLLGCPTSTEQPVPNTNGHFQNFQFGQIVWSPQQGGDMTVALYQQGAQLGLDWGDTFPSNYDKFIVRLGGYPQFDYTDSPGKISAGRVIVPDQIPGCPPPNPPPSPSSGSHSAIVEGCDTGLGGPTCNQSWTIPATTSFVTPPPPPPPPWPPDEFIINFSQLTPATTPTGAQTQLLQRGLTVAQHTACTKTLGDVAGDEEGFMEGAIAKLNLVSNSIKFCDSPPRPLPLQNEANSALRFQQIKSKPGSSADKSFGPLPLCKRTGEYDVALTGYITLVNRFGQLLDNDVRNHIVNDLLNLRGPFDQNDLQYCNDGPPETENHLNMMESARYLTNQLLYSAGGDPLYDNEANGMNQYMLSSLQSFLKSDFIEYNSKPYQTYTDNSLQNLFDFAKDRRVKMAARLVLDYISAKYAVSSSSLRRNAPYRRRVSHYSPWLLDHYADSLNARFTLLSGMFQIQHEAVEPDETQPCNIKDGDDLQPAPNALSSGYDEDIDMLAVSSYRAPDAILDLLMNPAHRNFYQRIRHAGVEIYSSRPDYLITAGGYWMGSPYTAFGASDADDDGPAVQTTLMPTDHFINISDMIRIDGIGAIDTRERINTCVAPDFACGINPVVPNGYKKAACFRNQGSWNFVDFSSPMCNNLPFGFYAAVFIAPGPGSNTFGFFEAHPRDPNLSFKAFVAGVLSRNGNRTFNISSINNYMMTSGATVKFTIPVPGTDKYDWPLVSTDNAGLDKLGTDISKWPLASGDILNSVGSSGIVTFTNAGTGQHIILDFSDFGEPNRVEQ